MISLVRAPQCLGDVLVQGALSFLRHLDGMLLVVVVFLMGVYGCELVMRFSTTEETVLDSYG